MSQRLRSALIRVITVCGIVLLLLSIVSDSLPLMPNNALNVVRRASQQRGLSERIAKNAIILVRGDVLLRAQAISELQVTLPGCERIQRGLLSGDASLGLPDRVPDDVRLLLLQVRGDYSAIDAAAKNILAHPDETQLSIILDHNQQYYLTMASVADLWQDRVQDASQVFFTIKLTIGLLLISFWVLLIVLHRQERKAGQKKERQS